MCRYGEYGPYKEHYACFSCRKMFRRPSVSELAQPPAAGQAAVAPCPQCRTPMRDMGKDFKAPKTADVEQWRKVELLYGHGYTFHSCGCSGPGPRPERLRDVEPFLAEQERLRREAEHQQRLEEERERNAGRLRRREKQTASKSS